MANPDFDERLTTTLNNHRPVIVDNVFNARPLAFAIKESGNVKIDGGDRIVRPVRFAKNVTVMPYEGADTLNINQSEGPTSAVYDWAQVSGSVVITGIERARNSGSAQIISILEDRIQVLEETLIEYFNSTWWDDGSVAKSMNGLGNLVIDETATVGGINPADESLWAPKKEAAAGALALDTLATIHNSAAVGNDRPNVHLTTQALYEKYEGLLQPNVRWEDVDMANAGFQNVAYKGVPVSYDEDCPTGTWVMLNTKYIEAWFHEGTFMRPTPFVRPEDKDITISQILTYGNLAITNRARQGVLTGLT